MLGLCWHASSQILYTDRINTENSCPVLTLNRMFPCRSLLPTSVVQTGQNYFVYFFYNSFWAVWHLQSSPRSTPAVPVATLLGFNVHCTAIVITAPTSAIRAEVWERDCRCACALQSLRDFNWTQLLYVSFSKWHYRLYVCWAGVRKTSFDGWTTKDSVTTSFKVGHE